MLSLSSLRPGARRRAEEALEKDEREMREAQEREEAAARRIAMREAAAAQRKAEAAKGEADRIASAKAATEARCVSGGRFACCCCCKGGRERAGFFRERAFLPRVQGGFVLVAVGEGARFCVSRRWGFRACKEQAE